MIRAALSHTPASLERALPPLSSAIPITMFSLTALTIPLTTAEALGLSAAQTATWLAALYGVPGLLSLALTVWYRQPLLLAWNVSAVIFLASLAHQATYPELLGAAVLAGGVILLLGALGLTGRLAAWIPAPIVHGLLAGAVMPYVTNIFTAIGDEPAIAGGAFAAYVLGRSFLGRRIPAILPALITGLAIAGLAGRLGQTSVHWSFPVLTATVPSFITLQSNLPSVIFMRGQGYHPPERAINSMSGAGTVVGSFLGPTPVCMAVLLTPLAAGPDAGEPRVRHWSVYASAGALVLIALMTGVTANAPAIIPLPLLLALAGMALVGVLAHSLEQVTRGPLRLGPLFAFVIALSKISLLGFGPLFWSLALGMAISLLLERDELRVLRDGVAP